MEQFGWTPTEWFGMDEAMRLTALAWVADVMKRNAAALAEAKKGQ